LANARLRDEWGSSWAHLAGEANVVAEAARSRHDELEQRVVVGRGGGGESLAVGAAAEFGFKSCSQGANTTARPAALAGYNGHLSATAFQRTALYQAW